MEWKFATTLIGSLPYNNPVDAIDVLMESQVSCPSWPQLPARGISESMYAQTGCRLPGLKIEGDKMYVDLDDFDPTDIYTAILSDDTDYFSHPPESFKGLYEFLSRDLSSFISIKGQVTGPISEGLQILDKKGRPVIYDESYSEIVRKTVNMMAKWQARRLRMCNENAILFFDEPSLSMLGTPFASISDEQAEQWINEAMDGVDCYRGIHCCGNTNWTMVLNTHIDILSFDAYQYGDNLLMYPEDLDRFISRGGSIAWGIIPNTEDALNKESVESLVQKLDSFLDKMETKGMNRQKIAEQSLISPQCGLSGLSPEHIDKVFALLKGVSDIMRKRYRF